MGRIFFILGLYFCFSSVSFAQGTRIDSLLNLFEETESQEQKVDLLNQISSDYYDYFPDLGFDYASRASTLASKIKYQKGLSLALSLKGFYFFQSGDYKSALEYYRNGASAVTEKTSVLGYNYVLTGNLYRTIANYDSAHAYYARSISLLQSIGTTDYLPYAYRNLGKLYVLQWKNEEAEVYFNKALKMYDANGKLFGRAEVCFALGDLSKNRAEFKMAEEYISQGCEIANELEDEYLRLHCVINHGEVQYRLGDYIGALETLLQAVDLLNKRDIPQLLSRVYGDLGDVYDVLGQNDVALRYYFEGLKIAEHLDIPYEIASHQSDVAWIYKNLHDFKIAFEFVDRSIAIRETINDEVGLSSSYNTKGIIYFEQKQYHEAEQWLNKSLEIRKRTNHLEGEAICLYNLALLFEKQEKYKQSLNYNKEALRIEKIIGNKYNLAVAFNSIGSVYSHLKQFDSASFYLREAQQLGELTRSMRVLMNNSFFWSAFFEAQGDTKQALEWHKNYARLNDSIYYDNSANKLAEMQALYQTDKKDQEIKLLQQERLLQQNELQLQRVKISQQHYIIISIVVGFLLVSLLAFKIYKYNQQIKRANISITEQKEELQTQAEELKEAYHIIEYINKKLEAKVEDKTSALEQAYKELDMFFYRASHDFRRPLTTFLGLAEVANISVKDPNALELFSKVRDTAKNLDKMLLKLQSISDMGSQQMVHGEVYIAGIFNELCELHREDIEARHIRTFSSVVLPFAFYSYPALVNIVIENLFENAISFSRYENGTIRLRAFVEEQHIVVEVEDNGEGIGCDIRDKIFQMYFRGSERSRGNGLGLYIVKKAVKKLGSTITFTSQPGKGSVFKISFPAGQPLS